MASGAPAWSIGSFKKPFFPAQIPGCQAEGPGLRANSKKYAVDAERIGVVGACAGGWRAPFPVGGHFRGEARVCTDRRERGLDRLWPVRL